MAKGDKYILAADVISTFSRGQVYGRKGEEVTEIGLSDKTLTVQGKRQSFPVNMDKLLLKTQK